MAEVNIYSGSSVSELRTDLANRIIERSDDISDISTVIRRLEQIDFVKGSWLLSGKSCPKCAKYTVIHYYELVGGAEYYDSFSHFCANPACDYDESKDLYGGQDGNIDNKCPFCQPEEK